MTAGALAAIAQDAQRTDPSTGSADTGPEAGSRTNGRHSGGQAAADERACYRRQGEQIARQGPVHREQPGPRVRRLVTASLGAIRGQRC